MVDRPAAPVLVRLQRGLERLYRIDTEVAVADFVIGAAARARLGLARAPREQLLLVEGDDSLDVGLFVDERSLANLERHDPSRGLDDRNLGDFLLAVEGVSHFVYLVWRARAGRAVSALELELQAEVDKFVTCVLASEARGSAATQWQRRLFVQFELEDGLEPAERDRYRVANQNAGRYSASLARRFLRGWRVVDMLAELRNFYRLSLAAKLDFIRAAA